MGRKTDKLFGESYFTPNKINPDITRQIFAKLPQSVKDVGLKLLSEGWRFYGVDQARGYCMYREKVITIPAHAIATDSKIEGYKCWYVCHEMAHAIAGSYANHGPRFMEILKRICPEEYLHHELGYKPRNAASAGITNTMATLGF